MSDENSGVWWDSTWNPVVGCSPVSPGCLNCYAARMARRLGSNPATPQFAGLTVDGKWTGETRHVWKVLCVPFARRKPQRIFVCSMGDLFHESVSFEYLDQVFAVMAQASQHTFMLLTKRPERMEAFCSPDRYGILRQILHESGASNINSGWPLPNVILMATAEDQTRADERMPHIAELTGRGWRTGVSVEPMLGPVDLSPWLEGWMCRRCGVARLPMGEHGYCDCPIPDDPEEAQGDHRQGMVDWVIAGGETGPDARPAHPDWFRSLRDQCADAGTPFFFKQWGEHLPAVRMRDWDWRGHKGLKHYLPPDLASLPCRRLKWDAVEQDGSVLQSFKIDDHPDAYNMFRVGKARAGRILDGVEHNAFPEVRRWGAVLQTIENAGGQA